MFLGTFPERILPNWGKHRAQLGQARCPTWASTVPISCTFLFSLPMTVIWSSGYSQNKWHTRKRADYMQLAKAIPDSNI
jgi:hypothetical protein